MKDSRQVKRAKERQIQKELNNKGDFQLLELYYIPMKRKSRAGIEYIYYKKVVDKIGLRNKNVTSIKNIINKGNTKS